MEDQLFAFLSKYMTLTEGEKNLILELDVFRTVPKGHVLLEAGDRTEESFFVLKGCLRCYYIVDGEERTTSFYTELENVSPACIVTKEPSAYYIACVEDSVVIVGEPSKEKYVFEKFPRFETLCRLLTEELLVKNQITFDTFKNSSPEERYRQLLETRPDLVQRVPQHQLASFLGIKPESLSRIRKRLLKPSAS